MLTWTSVVADAPSDTDIATVIACREALVIRPLIEFAPLRRAMGLPSASDLTDEAPETAAAVAAGRRRLPGSAAAPTARATSRTAAPRRSTSTKRTSSSKQPGAATTGTGRIRSTAAA